MHIIEIIIINQPDTEKQMGKALDAQIVAMENSFFFYLLWGWGTEENLFS